jgi:tetratricopeptide (TPR) repeat protein
MKKLFDSIQARLSAFVAQRRDLALIFTARDEDNLLLAKILESIDKQGDSPQLFLIFAEPFEAAHTYVQSIVETFRARHAGICKELEKAGEPPWPPLPHDVEDRNTPPVKRLQQCLTYARDQLPASAESQLVIALCPTHIANAEAHARFIAALLRHEQPIPWYHHMRLLVREDVEAPVLSEHWRTLPRTQWYAPDLSQAAMQRSIEDEVNDAEAPLPQRLHGLLILASLDYAHGRYPDALAKYKLLSHFYQTTQDLPMFSLILNAMGETLDRAGQRDLARRYYESALTPAIESKAHQVLINTELNLGRFHETDKNWAEALQYYQGACPLADASLNAPLKILCLERMGFCAYSLKKPDDAEKHWQEAASLARGLEASDQLKGVLLHLKQLYGELRMNEQRSRVELELASIQGAVHREG